MDFTFDILSSVIGVAIGAILIWIGKIVWPILEQKFLHDEMEITGEWKTTFEEKGMQKHETVKLKQRGRKIEGEIVLTEEGGKVITYKFEGTFKHRILTATYESTDRSDYEQGAFALSYRKNYFKGQYIFIEIDSDELISSKYEWNRA